MRSVEDKKENSAEKSGAQISGEQEELWKVTPDQVIYLRKKDSPLSGFIPTPDITLIGEPITMGSLAAAIEQKCGKKVQLLCPLEITEGLLRRGDEAIRGEEAMEEKLKTARIIVAILSTARSARKVPLFMRCRILHSPEESISKICIISEKPHKL